MGEQRRTRAEDTARTRERILAAARELFLARPFAEVTLNRIAETAGVTRQTVLNHFASKDNVFLDAAATVTAARDTAPVGDVPAALDALMEEYEQVGDTLIRLLQVEEQFEAVRAFLVQGRRSHLDWVASTFASHLPADPAARERTVLALATATDVYAWRLLRRDRTSDAATTREVIGALVAGVLVPLTPALEQP